MRPLLLTRIKKRRRDPDTPTFDAPDPRRVTPRRVGRVRGHRGAIASYQIHEFFSNPLKMREDGCRMRGNSPGRRPRTLRVEAILADDVSADEADERTESFYMALVAVMVAAIERGLETGVYRVDADGTVVCAGGPPPQRRERGEA
jgi:hypothetical protein